MQPKPAPSANLLALPEGTELVGDYRIKRVLGAGGFGITYLADEIALARDVTIKEYFPADFAARGVAANATPRSQESAPDYQWGLDRFIEEAQTLARFVHPNIVRVYRYFRANDTGYMVLHFEEGGSFKSWLKNLKRAPRQAELDEILAPLLDALDMVHKGNFLHRDIAPDNIMMRKDRSPVLIDFGSARGEIASHTRTVSALVKPGYSPYEQYATTSRQQGPWTDIYALGATLYHAITGKRPPDAPSRMVNDEYVPAREAALSSYRASFLAAIDKALRLEVTERPQSIAEWRGQLLAPEPKRERTGRFGLPLGRKRAAAVEAPPPARDAASEAAVPLADAKAETLVPAPPDAPQPKGQLLDFIDALRRKPAAKPASVAAPKADAAAAARVAPLQARLQALGESDANGAGSPKAGIGVGAAAALAPPKPSPARAEAKPKAKPAAAKAAKAAAKAATNKQPPKASAPPPTALNRTPPRPSRIGALRLPSRKARALLFKLSIGLGVAGLAVAYQDKVPQLQGRGAGVVSSQQADIAQPVRLVGHTGPVIALSTADQGRWVVSAGTDATLRIWNAGSGSLIRTIELDDGPPTALAVEDRRALTGHKGGTVVLWDLERAEKLKTFQHQDAPIAAVAFTADPDMVAVASQSGAVAAFDVRAPSAPVPVSQASGEGGTGALAVARARGVLVANTGEHGMRLWRTEASAPQRAYRTGGAPLTAVDLSPNARAIVAAAPDGTLTIWSTASSRPHRIFNPRAGRITALAFAPNDRLYASASNDGQIRLWNVSSSRSSRTFKGHTAAVRALRFSADGRQLVSGGDDGVIRIWNLMSGPAG